ncbi:hypothetical protein RND81_14G174400 [Saponaria officinalis]|uniref:25S rRNA (uridine-N(3))-methyltransferase BMT5-like domain-containing protein n=1 Tax=Saponaria officinalis TaxID=3572 RepID=A0AAW1GN20_SAPOF
MGQIFSCVWRCIRSHFRNETKTSQKDDQLNKPFDPLQEQESHYITIPDGETETRHVSSSASENVSADLTPDVPSWVVDIRNVENDEKLIQVVEEKMVNEKEVINNVCNDSKESFVKKIGVYNSKQRILLVGEGDFSFSACLAVAFGSASNIIATSLNSHDFLTQNYKKFMINKIKLESRGGVVMHGIDARRMIKDPVLGSLKFDCIVFNFPHTGDFGGTEFDLRNNKELVRVFIRSAKKMINEDGEIHIRHKSNGYFSLWNIPKIGSDQGLLLIRKPKFDRSQYPGYHTKYGFGGNKDFDCTPSRSYIFGLLA